MQAAKEIHVNARSDIVAWETFPHGADEGVRGFGSSMAEAFANAGLALTSVITDPGEVKPLRRFDIVCQAPGSDILLLDWLNRLISTMATEQVLFGRYDVRIEGDRLTAAAFGEPIDVARHAPAVEVKGATFTELRVGQTAGGRWVAQCVVDV